MAGASAGRTPTPGTIRSRWRIGAATAGAVLERRAIDSAVVLGYHGVRADASGYHVTPESFRLQLDVVRRAGYRFTTFADLADRLRHVVSGGSAAEVAGLAVVTFDDGFAELQGDAMRVLTEAEVPATLFVVTSTAGHDPAWWPGQGRTLDPDEIGALAASPLIDIGSHTRRHRSLPTLSDGELVEELAGSRADLEAWTGSEVRTIAYPSGHHDPRVRAAVADAGYTAACSFRNGRVVDTSDPLRLPRMAMDARHGVLRWAAHLSRPAGRWPEPEPDAELGT